MKEFITRFALTIIVLAALAVGVLRLGCFFYPKDYELTVKKYARVYDIPDELVFSVIKAESNYKKDATSNKGAKGLMQIMDKTGEWAAQKIDIENYNPQMLYDPAVNIEIGCFYLSYLLDLYSGNEENAIAAYNAGPANVDEWLKDKECSKNGKTLDHIPFGETKNYVKKVIKNIKLYEFLY